MVAVPDDDYAIGADIAMGGTGAQASNSTLCGISRFTGHQVMSYAVKGVRAYDFAKIMAAVARWMRNAYLGWEATGPGESIIEKEILGPHIGYYNVYFRTVRMMGGKKEKKPGWLNKNQSAKRDLFEAMELAFAGDKFIPRDEEMIVECGEYEIDQKGDVIHAPTKIKKDSQGAHGDRCIAAGVVWIMCDQHVLGTGIDKDQRKAQNPGRYTIARYLQDREEEKTLGEIGGNHFPLWEAET
jgi:hypothetical protein